MKYILFEWIPVKCDFTVHSQFKNLCPKSHKIVYFLPKAFIKKKSTPGNRIGVACTGRLICAFVVLIWQNRFSHDVTHFQIDRSYLCHIRKKEFVASNFTVKKKTTTNKTKQKQLLIYHSGCHFCRRFLENKFAVNSSICVRNWTMWLFV